MQGFGIRPMLFIIYITDLDQVGFVFYEKFYYIYNEFIPNVIKRVRIENITNPGSVKLE